MIVFFVVNLMLSYRLLVSLWWFDFSLPVCLSFVIFLIGLQTWTNDCTIKNIMQTLKGKKTTRPNVCINSVMETLHAKWESPLKTRMCCIVFTFLFRGKNWRNWTIRPDAVRGGGVMRPGKPDENTPKQLRAEIGGCMPMVVDKGRDRGGRLSN